MNTTQVETSRRTGGSPQSIAAEELSFLKFKVEKHYTFKLPLCLFLVHHDQGTETKMGTAADVLRWVREWLSASDYAGVVRLDAETQHIAGLMRELHKVRLSQARQSKRTVLPSAHHSSVSRKSKRYLMHTVGLMKTLEIG